MPDEIDDIIDAVIDAETDDDNPSKVTNDPSDGGGRTQYGIAERSNPRAWADGKVTEEEARAIYRRKYVDGPGFSKIVDSRLQHFLVDWGVISGPGIAIKYLQQAIGTTVDGILGPKSLQAANEADPGRLLNQLVDARVLMMCRIVQKAPSQARFIVGRCKRALEFRV